MLGWLRTNLAPPNLLTAWGLLACFNTWLGPVSHLAPKSKQGINYTSALAKLQHFIWQSTPGTRKHENIAVDMNFIIACITKFSHCSEIVLAILVSIQRVTKSARTGFKPRNKRNGNCQESRATFQFPTNYTSHITHETHIYSMNYRIKESTACPTQSAITLINNTGDAPGLGWSDMYYFPLTTWCANPFKSASNFPTQHLYFYFLHHCGFYFVGTKHIHISSSGAIAWVNVEGFVADVSEVFPLPTATVRGRAAGCQLNHVHCKPSAWLVLPSLPIPSFLLKPC